VDHVVVVVVCDDADFEEPSGFVWSDDHGEVGLVGDGDGGHGVLECVAYVVVGDPMLVGAWRISTATTLVVIVFVGNGREGVGTGSALCLDLAANAERRAVPIGGSARSTVLDRRHDDPMRRWLCAFVAIVTVSGCGTEAASSDHAGTPRRAEG
jgi:hypothetical protein